MRKLYIFSLLIVCGSIVAWCQDCRVDGAASFTDVRSAVLRFTTEHMYSGWDAKIWNRSGDMAAVAIVKTIPDAQMTSPNTLRDVLFILHEAWARPPSPHQHSILFAHDFTPSPYLKVCFLARVHLIKFFLFDGDGLCLLQKRLERGRFRAVR